LSVQTSTAGGIHRRRCSPPCSYDRRGRGDSGNGLPVPIEVEIEDLAAVVAATGRLPFVYGHSSGGALELEAAARGVEMRRLAVCEPPYTDDAHPGPEFGDQLDQLVAAGRRDQAAETWLSMTGTPPAIIESIKRGPGWAHRQALAHTLSQDLRLTNHGRIPIERLERINVPVLVMAGAASPPWAPSTAAALAGALPHVCKLTVDGQQHLPADPVVATILESFFQ
jgi:pimeloyl-ACP methyl ester carboxylesterase